MPRRRRPGTAPPIDLIDGARICELLNAMNWPGRVTSSGRGQGEFDRPGRPARSRTAEGRWVALCRSRRERGTCAARCRMLTTRSGSRTRRRGKLLRHFVPTRIIEPTSKPGSLRVLNEVGVKPPSCATISRLLPGSQRHGGNSKWRPHARRTRNCARLAGSCTTCRRCTSRPMPGRVR